jgi:hypothetical protein
LKDATKIGVFCRDALQQGQVGVQRLARMAATYSQFSMSGEYFWQANSLPAQIWLAFPSSVVHL